MMFNNSKNRQFNNDTKIIDGQKNYVVNEVD